MSDLPARLLEAVVSRAAVVVEASAGTGKTYQLEQLALGLLGEGRARIDEILVVTFTERATAELVARIRATIDKALARPAHGESTDDQRRRRLLAEARRSFDQACITTIHSFCQGLLMDEPLATGRLLGQAQVDSQAAFGEVFRDVLRRLLSTEPEHLGFLNAFLAGRRDAFSLEALLYRAAVTRGTWAAPHDELALARAVADLTALDLTSFDRLWSGMLGHPSKVGAMKRRLQELGPAFIRARDDHDWPALLSAVDERANERFCEYVEQVVNARNLAPAVGTLGRALTALVTGPTLTDATVQRFLPAVREAVEAHKLARGLYDFDDMIGAAARAVEGPAGAALIAKLRRRFRFALIDEAQDTDALQWQLFERIFLDSNGANPCVLIGDPKQAIYGFRGADVNTYVQAREAIVARAGEEALVPLEQNHRSAREVLGAVNAILDQNTLAPFFTNPSIGYDRPVESARGPQGDGAGVTLFKLDLAESALPSNGKLRVGPIKQALRRAIATEIAWLRQVTPDDERGRPFRLSSIFVLTRSNAEAREVGNELRQHGIAHTFYKQEGLWKSAEAEHVRTLLRAIEDPLDRVARLQAWLTPFFGLTLAALQDAGAPPHHHPLMARLFAWKRLGDARDYPALFAQVLDESGVTRRLRLTAAGERTLTLYGQLFDQLLADTATRRLSLGELASSIGRYKSGLFPPTREGATRDTDIQRADVDHDAVQIVTMHKAKGLEAEHVFLYGALTNMPLFAHEVHAFYRDDQRVLVAGKPRLPDTIARIKQNRDEENQRLLYVALTRARHHLYMPFFPGMESDGSEIWSEDRGDYKAFDKVTGPYRLVNDRLRHLAADRGRFAELFTVRMVPYPTPELPVNPGLGAALAAWRPALAPLDPPVSGDAAALRATRRGFVITSYSRLKDAAGGYQPPVLDEDPLPAPAIETSVRARADELPGGAATGLFLHGVLEKAALGPLPPLAEWERQPEVRALLEAECRRWDRDPRYLPAAARVVHASLRAPMLFGGVAPLAGIAAATRVRREVDFLFSLADVWQGGVRVPEPRRHEDDRLVREPGFIRGVLDVLFEHEGRAYFADWKSDMLPSYAPHDLRAHVEANYELQIQIYTVALFRLLGIEDRRDCEQRFGGLAYVFLRGVEADGAATPPDGDQPGVLVRRPDYDEIRAWESALVARPTAMGAAWA